MRILICLWIMLFVLSGCYWQERKTIPSGANKIPPMVRATEELAYPASSPTNISLPTRISSPSKLPTYTPPVVSTRTNTPDTIATLTRDEALTIIDVLDGVSGCKLPCWLGLTPGISTFSDIQGFAAKLGEKFLEDRYNKEDDVAFFHVTNSENGKENPSNIEGNPTLIEVRWQKGVIKSIVIHPNEVPKFLSVDTQRDYLGDPDDIFLMLPYGKTMGFILNYQSHGFVFALSSITSKQATICLGDSLDKSITLVLYDPVDPVDIPGQVNLFGDLVWKTQADPGYSTKDIMDRMVSNKCLHYLDFSKQW